MVTECRGVGVSEYREKAAVPKKAVINPPLSTPVYAFGYDVTDRVTQGGI